MRAGKQSNGFLMYYVIIKYLQVTQAFQYMQLSIADSHMEFLLEHFDQTYEFIETAKSKGGSILIHCMGGVSRSPTIVMKFQCNSNLQRLLHI